MISVEDVEDLNIKLLSEKAKVREVCCRFIFDFICLFGCAFRWSHNASELAMCMCGSDLFFGC